MMEPRDDYFWKPSRKDFAAARAAVECYTMPEGYTLLYTSTIFDEDRDCDHNLWVIDGPRGRFVATTIFNVLRVWLEIDLDKDIVLHERALDSLKTARSLLYTRSLNLQMEPGPAFIPYTGFVDVSSCDPTLLELLVVAYKVPSGYIWQPATDHTGAGWVRPKGRNNNAV